MAVLCHILVAFLSMEMKPAASFKLLREVFLEICVCLCVCMCECVCAFDSSAEYLMGYSSAPWK